MTCPAAGAVLAHQRHGILQPSVQALAHERDDGMGRVADEHSLTLTPAAAVLGPHGPGRCGLQGREHPVAQSFQAGKPGEQLCFIEQIPLHAARMHHKEAALAALTGKAARHDLPITPIAEGLMAPTGILNRHLAVHEVHFVEGHLLLTEHGLRHGRANAICADQHVILPAVPACPGVGFDRARLEIHGFHCRAVQPPNAGPGVHRFLEQLLQDYTRNGEDAPPVFIIGMKAATGPILPAPHPQPAIDDRLLQAAAAQRMATALAEHELERTGRRHAPVMAFEHRDGVEMGLQQESGHEADRTAARDEEMLIVHGMTV